jgi:multidrug resistance efflux pump
LNRPYSYIARHQYTSQNLIADNTIAEFRFRPTAKFVFVDFQAEKMNENNENSKNIVPTEEKDAKPQIGIAPTRPAITAPAADADSQEAVTTVAPPATKAGTLATSNGGSNRNLGRPTPGRSARARRRPRTNPLNWVLILLLAAAAGVGSFFYFRGQQVNPAFQGQTYTMSNRNAVTTSFSSNGQVQANADLSLSFTTGGTITKLHKKLGDTVQAGEIIAYVDDSDLQYALRNAQSSYDQQLANYRKATEGASQKDLDIAQAQVDSARANLTKTINGTFTAQDVASANASVNAAATNLAELRAGGKPQDIAAAQAAISSAEAQLASARAKLAKTQAGPDNAAIVSAQTTYDQAVASYERQMSQLELSIVNAQVTRDQSLNTLKTAQEKYAKAFADNRDASGKIKENLSQAAIDNETTLFRAMEDAQGNYNKSDIALNDAKLAKDVQKRSLQSSIDNAKAQLDKTKAGPTAADLAADQASVASAQSSLDNAKKSLIALTPTQAQIASAESQLASAQASLSKLRGGTPEEITVSESNVRQSEATLAALRQGPNLNDMAIQKAQLDVAQSNLDKAKANLNNAILKSPISGTIVKADLKEGQVASASTVIYQVVDFSVLRIEVNVGESDIGKVKEGMAVAINLDSMPGRSFTGKVTFIASKSTVTNNVVSYLATVTLDQGQTNSLFEAYPAEFEKILQSLTGGRGAPGGATGFPGGAGAGGTGFQIPGNIQLPRGAAAQIAAQTGVCGYSPLSLFTQDTSQPKVGMTANVTFCQSLKAGNLSVPNRAIQYRTTGGQRVAYLNVLTNRELGTREERPVVVGTAGDSYTEISGGNIKEGDIIILTTTSNTGGNRTGTTTGTGGAVPGAGGAGGNPIIQLPR